MTARQQLTVRIAAAALLAACAAVLFIFGRSAPPSAPVEEPVQDLRQLAPSVDRAVDSVLAVFSLGKASRRTVAVSGAAFQRIEKIVTVPPAFSAVQLNQALSAVARGFGGRVVASENLKERLVTMHVELRGMIIETLVVRTAADTPAPRRTRPAPRRGR